mgnify:CR=1 FL=1|jgi:hypothetical protein
MTTFDRVRKNILRDMASRKTHTAESWAHIMLENTCRLTNTAEQEKFWEFMQNPTGEERAPPVCGPMLPHVQIDQPDTIMCPLGDDEKSGTVEMENTFTRNGMSMYITSKPTNRDLVTSEQLPIGRLSLCENSDERKDFEMV